MSSPPPRKRAKVDYALVTPPKAPEAPPKAPRGPLPPWAAAGLAHVSAADGGRLRALVEAHYPDYLHDAPLPPFVALSRIVVGQQLAGKAAQAIWLRSLVAFRVADGALLLPQDVLRGAFEGSLDDETRAAAGLSRAKATALVGIAVAFESGALCAATFEGPSDVMAAQLLALKGVGPWSVHMFRIFSLKQPDVLPLGDLAVRNGARKVFKGHGSGKAGAFHEKKDAAVMEQLFEPYKPFRSLATYYMWRAVDTTAFNQR
jgi:DNA-3-methyladenine glycosylase II